MTDVEYTPGEPGERQEPHGRKAVRKGHVPDWQLMKYRQIKRLADQLKSLGDTIGANDMRDSTILWRMAKKYQDKANELRVDLPREGQNDD